MPNPCEMPQDYANATETVVMTILENVSATAAATDSVVGTLVVGFSDIAAASETLVARKVIWIRDTANATDRASKSQRSEVTIHESARAHDEMRDRHTILVHDTAAATGVPTAKQTFVIRDHAAASDTPDRAVSNETAVSATAKATEKVTGSIPRRSVSDSADASETVTLIQKGAESPTDIAVASETIGASKHTSATIVDIAHAYEAVGGKLKAVQKIIDIADAEDYVTSPGPNLSALWTNTMSAAPCTWSKLPFNSFIEIDGVVYGATAAGIGVLTPGVGAVDSKVMWDVMNFKDMHRHQLDCAYIAGTSDDPLVMVVTPGKYSYRYVAHVASPVTTQNLRFKFGKGIKAEFIRFTLKNASGSDFSVSNSEVMVGASSRKIGGRYA